MKAMYIGLSPNYEYPGSFAEWQKNNTRYASNHGACLISRSIAKEFSADYVDDFSNVKKLNESYDVCYLAFATHIHPFRDITVYAELVEKLEMKVIALSLGVQDYITSPSAPFTLHPSVIRLLNAVSRKSEVIGVRGHYTASVLYRAGFSNVVAIGCPTFYSNLARDMSIEKKDTFSNPLCVYQSTMAEHLPTLLESAPILGQDFQDHVIFTDQLENDEELRQLFEPFYERVDPSKRVRELINQNGVFPATYGEWYESIGERDFVYGPRLHANVAALLQGVPGLMLTRDLRVTEIVEFYSLPHFTYEQAAFMSLDELYHQSDYSLFNEVFQVRYDNYLCFLKENALAHNLDEAGAARFSVTLYDARMARYFSNNVLPEVRATDLSKSAWKAIIKKLTS